MTNNKETNTLDMPFYGAFGCCCLAFLLTLVAFSSPYWLESYPESQQSFLRMGLWSVCFDRYIHQKDYHANVWNGCYWIFNWDLIVKGLWEYLGKWLISVQVLVTAGFVLQCVSMICMILYFLLLGNPAAESTMSLFSQGLSGLFLLAGALVFGIRTELRDWMPRPDHNFLSWAFGFAVLASLVSFMSCGFLYCVAKSDKALEDELQFYQRAGYVVPMGGDDVFAGPGSVIQGQGSVLQSGPASGIGYPSGPSPYGRPPTSQYSTNYQPGSTNA